MGYHDGYIKLKGTVMGASAVIQVTLDKGVGAKADEEVAYGGGLSNGEAMRIVEDLLETISRADFLGEHAVDWSASMVPNVRWERFVVDEIVYHPGTDSEVVERPEKASTRSSWRSSRWRGSRSRSRRP